MASETTPLITPPASPVSPAAAAQRKNRLAIGFAAAAVLFLATAASLWWVSQKGETPLPVVDDADFFCGLQNFETGYVKLANKKDDHYFYWLVQSSSAEPEKDPLVLWLTGGPGAPSTLGLLSENGPCLIQPDSTEMKLNEYAWTNEANVIWLDQPTNVGFSFGSAEDADSTSENVGENIYWFLQGFLDKHPEFEGREFFITGESYGGHYVPAAAHYIWQQSKLKKKSKEINLKGIAIGNGYTDPAIQIPHYMDMVDNAYNITFVNASQLAEMRVARIECERLMAAAGVNSSLLMDADSYCQEYLNAPIDAAKRNPYDIREFCDKEQVNECIPTDHIRKYLERPHVREFLNVSDKANKWQMVNFAVSADFVVSGDIEFSYSSYVANLLDDDIRVLIYAGDADLACNWYGNQAWTKALVWKGKQGFNAAEERAFVTSAGVDAGVVCSSLDNQLTFLRVFNSGHMVPQHQPAVALDMITKFFKNQPF